jgi:hypothetical protein
VRAPILAKTLLRDGFMELRLYYSGKTLSDMEVMLRNGYLLKSGWLESAERKLALRNGEPVPWFT